MSCDNYNFPINIKTSNKNGGCSDNCKLECDYHNSACIATNKGSYISLSYDKITKPPVKYNNISLDVNEIRIYSPSLHQYEGVNMDGEMVVIHKGNDSNLAVCIPIKINNEDNDNTLNELIDQCTTYVPNDGDTNTLTLNDYNLTSYIPVGSPYITYSSKLPFDCDKYYNVIVFGNKEHYIPATTLNIDTLRKTISSESYNIDNNMKYFVNSNGVLKNKTNTFIRCYSNNEIPDNLPDKNSIDTKTGDIEGFEILNNIIEDRNSIHIGYIIGGSIALYGLYLFMKQVLKKQKK